MKTKISNFADYASILPGVQQVIGVPIVCYHLFRVIQDLFKETFNKEEVQEHNEFCDARIYSNKMAKLEYFLKTENPSSMDHFRDTGESLKKSVIFNEELYKKRYEHGNYIGNSLRINDARASKIDSIARLSELGFAFLRTLPFIGTCYSLYVYKTSDIYRPLIPNFQCGAPD